MSAFWTVTANWFVPASKFTFRIAIATIEDTIALGFAFDDLSLMTAWTLDSNLFYNRLCVTAVWEIATSIEFTKTTELNHHRTATNLTVKSSWLILDLDFFHFFFSLGDFFREWFIKFINDTLPLLFTNFDIIQFSFHLSCEGHIDDIWEIFNNEFINNFSQFCRFKAFSCQTNIVAFLDGFNGRSIG
ncbi:hypothetical protein SORDD15_00396 [Streptococcus oralis]|uniref:Uncharacterized protein n=1 Tax=Streptococcus oralis TaxID=1303 RepID=A0A139P1T5_STROR|nr:hypothetical protein SORDD15_00396 [Streptococcus oralis]